MKVVYGHTDSLYVQMPFEQAEQTRVILNNHVRNLFPNLFPHFLHFNDSGNLIPAVTISSLKNLLFKSLIEAGIPF